MLTKAPDTLPRGIFQRKPDSRLFYIRYTDARGKQCVEEAGTYQMAEDLLIQRRIEKLRRKMPGQHNPIGVKMNEVITDAINYAFANNDPIAAHDLRLKLERIRVTFGDKDVAQVRRKDIVSWLDMEALARKWKPASRNRYQSAWSMMFRVALENGKIVENPATGIKGKQEDGARIRYLSREEESLLVTAINAKAPQYLPVFTLSLHTGMRLSEQMRCVVGDYDPTTGMMMVRQTKNKRGPKTRYVPLTPIAVNAYNQMCAGKLAGDPLYTNSRDEQMKGVGSWFDTCVDMAGLVDYSWHCNRHTAASRWVMSGTPLAVVSAYLGHSNIQQTNQYAHLIPHVNAAAIQGMMSYYADSAPEEDNAYNSTDSLAPINGSSSTGQPEAVRCTS
jgi:site-specific recombinase XerD